MSPTNGDTVADVGCLIIRIASKLHRTILTFDWCLQGWTEAGHQTTSLHFLCAAPKGFKAQSLVPCEVAVDPVSVPQHTTACKYFNDFSILQ